MHKSLTIKDRQIPQMSNIKNPTDDGPIYAIVATVRALLLVELASKTVVPLEWDRPEYYGISWQPGGKDMILTHSLLDNNELVDVPSYATSEIGILSEGDYSSPPFLSQPHQLVYASDGRIICTNTGRNSISVFDRSKPNTMQEARISNSRWDRLSLDAATGDHLNSVFESNGVLYVIAHRHQKGSALATFSYPDLELVNVQPIKDRTGLHNIWVTGDGAKISCHSETGSLIELTENEVLWESGSPIYTRGLAATADFVLVGESERTRRASRRYSTSGLWLLDRKTWRALDYLWLGPYGVVHEVRLLSGKDEAHHGHAFAGLGKLLTRDRRIDFSTGRLDASARAQKSAAMWKHFKLIFGSPTPIDNGGQRSNPDDLSLVICNYSDQTDRSLSFVYSIESLAAESHVSIAAYRGKGGDSDMDVLLIQRKSNSEAELSHWIHDGRSWSRVGGESTPGLPLSGEVFFEVGSEGLKLSINGERISGDSLANFPTAPNTLGIRWIGASIWPVKT